MYNGKYQPNLDRHGLQRLLNNITLSLPLWRIRAALDFPMTYGHLDFWARVSYGNFCCFSISSLLFTGVTYATNYLLLSLLDRWSTDLVRLPTRRQHLKRNDGSICAIDRQSPKCIYIHFVPGDWKTYIQWKWGLRVENWRHLPLANTPINNHIHQIRIRTEQLPLSTDWS